MTDREALAAVFDEAKRNVRRALSSKDWKDGADAAIAFLEVALKQDLTVRSEPDEGLDVDRLAQAMRNTTANLSSDWTHPGNAPAIAREYRALAVKEPKP